MKLFLKLLGTLIGLVVLAVIGLGFLAYRPLPSQDELAALYRENARAYTERTETIRQALARKAPVQSTPDEKLGYFAVDARADPFSVLYYTHSSGIGVGAYGLGIAYLTSAPNRIYGSLDAMKKDALEVEGFRGYGSIEGRWYYAMWEVD